MKALQKQPINQGISQEKAEAAVRDLLTWAGESPERDGLRDTPKRVVKAFQEYFAGYGEDPAEYLSKTFENVSGYNQPVILCDIDFRSHCEHHMAPIIGQAHVAYLPQNRVVGISKLARVVEIYAKRLQIQERMTADIAKTLHEALDTHGVLVIIEAEHHCMASRGVKKPGSFMRTMFATGVYELDFKRRQEILSLMSDFRIDTGAESV